MTAEEHLNQGSRLEVRMNMATLYHIGDDGSQAERWDLSGQPVIVGRCGQAQISIRDEGLSRRHFLIARDGQDYILKDLNSRNGTWVDGHRVFAERLRHYDHILAGHTRFLFVEPGAPSTNAGQSLSGPQSTVVIPGDSESTLNSPAPGNS